MKKQHFIGRSVSRFLGGLILTLPVSVPAELNQWTYVQERDRLTNLTYSLARSPIPQRGMYDYIRLEIVCKQNTLQFVVDGNNLIASQDRPFEIDYRIDQKAPVVVKMRTFKDSKQRGYTEDNVKGIVDDILSGETIFVRINTMIRRVLTGALMLNDAAVPISRVLSDCGVVDAEKTGSDTDYSLAKFEVDFNKLSVEHQKQVLRKLKSILQEFKSVD